MAKKKFDCLKVKDLIQEKIAKDIGRKSHKDQIEYFRQQAEHGTLSDFWTTMKHKARWMRLEKSVSKSKYPQNKF